MLIDTSTGDFEEALSVDEKYGAQSAVISEDGNIFYTSNLYGDNNSDGAEHSDSNGYDISYSLVRYNIDSKQTETLVSGVNNYYITGDRIYFDRIKNSDNSVRLYYTTFEYAESGAEPIDTGVDVAENYLGYMWTVKDGLVYYADDSGTLYSYDTDSKKTDSIFTSDKGIRHCGFWNDNIVFFSRYTDENNVYRSQISIYNTKTETETLVCEETLLDNENYDPADSEKPSNFIACDDENMDYFIMETNQVSGGGGSRYYKVYADGSSELIFESGWDGNAKEGE
jgi:hypothetical protein